MLMSGEDDDEVHSPCVGEWVLREYENRENFSSYSRKEKKKTQEDVRRENWCSNEQQEKADDRAATLFSTMYSKNWSRQRVPRTEYTISHILRCMRLLMLSCDASLSSS
jgi:hypothetical protein